MKPLSGMWLYINLGFAIIWDSLGFILFIVGLTPAVPVSVILSLILDVLAFLTALTFCVLYQGYVKLYNVNFRIYQVKRIKEMLRLSKSSGASNNPISQNLARQTQKINQYITDKFSNYVINFSVKKIQYSILTSTVEIIPWLGDFSPSWTIKANLHLREHRKTARELKIRTLEFEKSLAKWRGSLRIGGIRRVNTQSNNINSKSVRETAANNIRPFRKKLPSEAGQSLQGQKNINLDVRESAANNIVPFRRKVVGEGSQPRSGQNNNKLANVKSAAGNIASVGRQLAGSIPQSREYEDEELQYRKSSANKNKPSKTQVFSDISKPVQAQNNNNEYTNNISAANNIKNFNRDQQNQANSEQILETLIKK